MKFVDSYMASGWLQMAGAFKPALIDDVRAEYDRQSAALKARNDQLSGYTRVGEERIMLITVVVPLADLTPDTGTTRLFPGSHIGPKTDAFELPYLKRGDCFLMD